MNPKKSLLINYSLSCRSVEEELLGCQVSTVPHERRFIHSIQQLMVQLFLGSVDKPSLCFTMMAAKSTSLYSLDTKGLVVYTALSICTKTGAGQFEECSRRRSMGSQKRPSLSSWEGEKFPCAH